MTSKRARAGAKRARGRATAKLPPVTQAEYARHRGVSREAVRKALRNGRIRANANGLIDPAAADAAWSVNTVPSLPAADPAAPPEPPAPPEDGTQSGVHYSIPKGMTLVEAMTQKAYLSAQRVKLDLEAAARKLVEVALVEDVAFTAAHNARDRLLSLPDRIGDELATITNATDLKRRLREELRLVCDELAGDIAEREELTS